MNRRSGALGAGDDVMRARKGRQVPSGARQGARRDGWMGNWRRLRVSPGAASASLGDTDRAIGKIRLAVAGWAPHLSTAFGEMPPIDPAGSVISASLAMLKPARKPFSRRLVVLAGTVVLALSFFAILVAWLLSSH